MSVTVVAPSAAPEVDKIDIQRWGGFNTNWLNVGTTPTTSLTFTDTLSDEAASAAAAFSEDNVNFQPWPIVQIPFATTATSVTGSYILTTVALPTSLAQGTPIRVNGINTTFRRVISTTAKIYEMEDSLGTLTNATVEIPEPTILGQPLASWWGPFGGRFFGCGDSYNPGTLYWTNGNNPDSTQEVNKLEITAPSEPLVNGCVFNGRNYVWSSERMFEIEQINFNEFVYNEVPGGKGLWSRWALAVGNRMYFLGKDGIYESTGGEARSITDRDLYPLFPHEGQLGGAVNNLQPPNMISGQENNFQLSYYDNYLYFNYVDTSASRCTLVYEAESEEPGWFPDVYTPTAACHYGEEGQGVHNILVGGADAVTARLYSLAGTSDNGTAISWHLRTPSWDAEDRRANKLWGDFILDADCNNGTVTAALGLNNHATTATLSTTTMTSASRSQQTFDISNGTQVGAGIEARNVSLDLSGSSATAVPKIFLWEPSYIARPETTLKRGTDWDDCDVEAEKYFQGIWITGNTSGATRTFRAEYDGGTLAETVSVNHNGYITNPYSFTTPFIAKRVRLIPTDTNSWQEYQLQWIFEEEPPLVTHWESQQTSFGFDGFFHMREFYVTLTNTATVTITLTRLDDGATYTYSISAGTRKKQYKVTAPIKAKGISFTMTSASGFRVYKDDIAFMVKGWGDFSAFRKVNPFGHSHGGGQAQA